MTIFYILIIILIIVSPTIPGSPKNPAVANVYGVNSSVNPVKDDVKCKANRAINPISAELSSVFINFLVYNANPRIINIEIIPTVRKI